MRSILIFMMATSLVSCAHHDSSRKLASSDIPVIKVVSKEKVFEMAHRFDKSRHPSILNGFFRNPHEIVSTNSIGTFRNPYNPGGTWSFIKAGDGLDDINFAVRFKDIHYIIEENNEFSRKLNNLLAVTYGSPEYATDPHGSQWYEVADIAMALDVGDLEPYYHSKGICSYLVGGNNEKLTRYLLVTSFEPERVSTERNLKFLKFNDSEVLLFEILDTTQEYDPSYKNDVMGAACNGKKINKERVSDILKLPGIKLLNRFSI